MFRAVITDENNMKQELTTYDQSKVWKWYTTHKALGHQIVVYLNGNLFIGKE
jgi:hypothetical protein